ncbi:cytochrome P450 [Nocardioides terrisoli]|uniref:cytochrome P450 n=1 Tax=Nocardioides terrisoli TaxID=3388267 RepID=UPI00287B8804|nr:cytochrome P450 [Nocardioides marmorisolisilvae]
MTVSRIAAPLRRQVLRWTMGRRGGLDISMVRKIPASTTYPLRRVGVDPVPELSRARDSAPVTRLGRVFGMNIWLVSGYDAAQAVLADSTRFSNDLRHLLGTRERTDAQGVGGLGMTDPPDHTRLRRLLTPEFTRRRLARLDGRIDAIVAETLDALARTGPRADLVADFGFAIPFRVICDLLGLSVADRQAFHRLGAARFDLSEGGFGVFNAATESREFLINAVRRQRSDPGDGLIGALLTEHGSEFDDVELGGLADGVFLGGYETSASMLSMGAYVLSQNPDAYEALRRGEAAEVDAVVEELLRFLCPVQVAFPRFARDGMDLFGARVNRGDLVAVSLSGANRDPRRFDTPEEFDPATATAAHLAFGHGLHRCVGAELARMELRVALRGLARRFPDLALAVPVEELAFRELSAVHGIDALPVHLWAPTGTHLEAVPG